MSIVARLADYVYGALVSLYPAHFRHEFGAEMLAVFHERTEDAMRNGRLEYCLVLANELAQLLPNLVLEHRRALHLQRREPTVERDGPARGSFTHVAAPNPTRNYPSWPQTLLAGLPILLVGVGGVLATYLPYLGWQKIFGVVLIVLLISALGYAWIRGFPRWSYVYVLPILGVTVLGILMTVITGERLNLVVPVAVLIVMAIAIWMNGLAFPLRQLARGMWQDWTLLAFGMYGLMGVLTSLAFDDAHRNNQTPYYALAVFAGVAGAMLFLRSSKTWTRMAALVTAPTLVVLAGALDQAYFAGIGSFTFASHGWMLSVWLLSMSVIALPALVLGAVRYAVMSARG